MQTLVLQWQDNYQTYSRSMNPSTHIRIGRQEDCDIVLSHGMISRHHAEIWQQGNDWYLRNMSRTNLVHLDQHSLRQGETIMLPSGLQFGIGPVWFQATITQAVGAVPPSQVPTVLSPSPPLPTPPVPQVAPARQPSPSLVQQPAFRSSNPQVPIQRIPKLKCPRCETVQDYTPEDFCYSCGLALQAAKTVMVAAKS